MYLDEFSGLRLEEKLKNRINKIVQRDNYIYENESHFIRCAIIQLLKEREKMTSFSLSREKEQMESECV